jgi:hypothetical protein
VSAVAPKLSPGFRALRAVSFVHSAVYLALLTCWIVPGLTTATYWLGWAHGLLWIGMSIACLEALRRRIIPFWLAVVVVVIGGLGPFAGTAGFIVESRRIQSD